MRAARIFVLLTVCLFANASARACSCAGPLSACSSFWTTDAVFRGTVLEKTLIRPPATQSKMPDGTLVSLGSPGTVRVRISVAEGFRGVDGKAEITVETNEQGSACGYAFTVGQEYLVFAYASKAGMLNVSHCGMTHAVQDASADKDVQWMRGLATAPPGATVFGDIGVLPGMSRDGIRILLDRTEQHIAVPGTHRELTPDSKGNYRVEGLPAGTYTTSLVTQPGTTAGAPRSLTLIDKGCQNVSWNVSNDSHIRGRVVDGVGAPVPHVPVTLLTRDDRFTGEWGQSGFTSSDDNGRYSFDRVAPGDYLVVANQYGSTPTMPYPARYYPQAASKETAVQLHLSMAQDLSGMDVMLPMAMHTVTLPIQVVNADGKPATLAISVSGHVASTPYSAQPMTAKVDDIGDAMLPLYEGEEYLITALDSSGLSQRCGGPLRLVAKSGMGTQTIRIEHPWGNCLAQMSQNFKPPRQ